MYALQVLLAAGVEITSGQLAALSHEQVQGVHQWVLELYRTGKPSGVSAATEAACGCYEYRELASKVNKKI